MAAIQTHQVPDWSELRRIADLLHVGDRLTVGAFPFVFRGHEDADFQLEPTLHRAAKCGDDKAALPDITTLLQIEDAVTRRFRAMAPIQLDPAILANTKANIDWWTVMRHHGVPTRVLDWTTSLYIAAYFACSRLPTKNGSIYVLHAHTLNERMNAIHGPNVEHSEHHDVAYTRPDAPPVVSILTRQTALSDRMIAQQGVFMACRNVRANIDEVLADAMSVPMSGTRFLKLCIPHTAKPSIMRQLAAMNVSANSLFPDLDGVGRYLAELVMHRDTPSIQAEPAQSPVSEQPAQLTAAQ